MHVLVSFDCSVLFSRETKCESSRTIPGPPTSGRFILRVLLERKTTTKSKTTKKNLKKKERKSSEVSLVNFWLKAQSSKKRVADVDFSGGAAAVSGRVSWRRDFCGPVHSPDDWRAGLQLSVDTNTDGKKC